jgi:hypothetical protein
LCSSGHPETTQRVYASDLRLLLAVTGARELPLEELEEAAMLWLNANRRQWAPKTTLRRMTSIRAFARWMGMGEILDEYVGPKPARAMPHPIHDSSRS